MANPHSIPELDKLTSQATDYGARAIRQAYEMGRQDMRRELMALLSPSPNDEAPTRPHYDTNAQDAPVLKTKAPPGTVRPGILRLIEESSGVTTEHILSTTGFKENSVRGTLSTLAKEGKIERRLNEWFVKYIKASDGETSETARSSVQGVQPLFRETAVHDR
jgi:hypothetical protein